MAKGKYTLSPSKMKKMRDQADRRAQIDRERRKQQKKAYAAKRAEQEASSSGKRRQEQGPNNSERVWAAIHRRASGGSG